MHDPILIRCDGDEIRRARATNGLSQKKAARKCNVSENTFRKAEHEHPVLPSTVKQLCDGLGIEFEIIVSKTSCKLLDSASHDQDAGYRRDSAYEEIDVVLPGVSADDDTATILSQVMSLVDQLSTEEIRILKGRLGSVHLRLAMSSKAAALLAQLYERNQEGEYVISSVATNAQEKNSARNDIVADPHTPKSDVTDQIGEHVTPNVGDEATPLSLAERVSAVMEHASLLYRQRVDWLHFFREVLGVEGIARQLLPNQEEFLEFEQTDEFAAIERMILSLKEERRDPKPNSEPTRVITVRLPESIHEALRVEAKLHNTNVNKLCISKLLLAMSEKSLDDEDLLAAKASSDDPLEHLAADSLGRAIFWSQELGQSRLEGSAGWPSARIVPESHDVREKAAD